MKKLLFLSTWLLFIVACRKTDIVHEPPAQQTIALQSETRITAPVISVDSLNLTIYDSCTRDSIQLKGLETTKTTETNDTSGFYYIRYEIDLTNVIGRDLTNGRVYVGGGRSVNVLRSSNTSDNIFGRTLLHFTYRSNKDVIQFNQRVIFREKDGKVLINFDTGYIESCKIK